MESPTSSEIASRLERATRSALASCSFTLPPSPSPPCPSLSDFLSQNGPADALRCSHCQASLLRGPRSLFCFACGAPFQISSLPKISFRSSLAHRRLLDSLQIEGLEVNSEEPGDELSVPDLDASNYSKEESGGHKILPSSNLHPEMKNVSKKFDLGQYPVPTSTSIDTAVSISGRSVDAIALASMRSERQDSILDYSAQLEGISLEDFFASQIKSQDTVAVYTSTSTENRPGRVEGWNTQNGHKDSFWDPLTEYTIPDGDHATSRGFESPKESLWSSKEYREQKTDSLDDDESWEGDFQSAAPATEISTAEYFTFGQFAAPVMQPSDYNGLFVNPEMERKENVADSIGSRGLSDVAERVPRESTGLIMEDDNEIFVLQDYGERRDPVPLLSSERHQEINTERHVNLDTKRHVDLDGLFFGSIWQQNEAAPSMKDAIDEFSDRTSVEGSFINSATDWNGKGPVQSSLSNQLDLMSLGEIKATMPGNNSYCGGESHFKMLDDVFGKEQQTQSLEKANEMVGSLLAQLHDLSFMLADKLVIKTDNAGNMNHQLDLREHKLLL